MAFTTSWKLLNSPFEVSLQVTFSNTIANTYWVISFATNPWRFSQLNNYISDLISSHLFHSTLSISQSMISSKELVHWGEKKKTLGNHNSVKLLRSCKHQGGHRHLCISENHRKEIVVFHGGTLWRAQGLVVEAMGVANCGGWTPRTEAEVSRRKSTSLGKVWPQSDFIREQGWWAVWGWEVTKSLLSTWLLTVVPKSFYRLIKSHTY